MKLTISAAFCGICLAIAPALAADITITDGFARATAPGAKVGAAFMTVHNTGDIVTLIGASSDASERVEIHTHTMDSNGVMRMREVEGGLELPAGETVTLAPGGLHLMMMKLNDRLEEGETVALTLRFSDGSTMDLTVPVKSIAARMKHSDGHGMKAGHGEHSGSTGN